MKKYPPTPRELRQWMDSKGLSNKDVAKALRLSDGRVVRFWTSKKDPRPIPYPSWYTLRHKFGKGPGKKRDSEPPKAAQPVKARA
ncbi:MAG: hypothetical protein OXU77_04645 [Gammaproteobacteria bacterium]|nr:hypothetical protein [Gammaproteobacteria bacterium]MDE0443081.1 hypothetical protein [Gammaproteobacteria bacterium]